MKRKLILALYIIAVCVLCFTDSSSLPEGPEFFIGIPIDKIAHFLMFAPFPVVAYYAFERIGGNTDHNIRFALLTFLGGVLFALATETVQRFLPSRSMEPSDFLADTIGITLCSVATYIICNLRKK